MVLSRPIFGKEASRCDVVIRDDFVSKFDFCGVSFFKTETCLLRASLSEAVISQALQAVDLVWKDRIYTPLVTLWVFLGQVLSQDHSCRAAVARLIAHRVARGRRPCSAETGAYCQARKRLPEELFAEVARKVGQSLDNSAKKEWLWKDRRVYLFDGTTVSMRSRSGSCLCRACAELKSTTHFLITTSSS